MRIKALVLAAIGCGLLVTPVFGEQIVHLANGTEMAVVSHRVEDGMIYVDLGGDAEMAFPMDQVERIEEADSGVVVPLSGGKNRIVTPNSRPVSGSVPSRYSRDGATPAGTSSRPSGLSTDDKGVAVHRPYANDNHAGKRKIGVAGNERVFGAAPNQQQGSGGPVGTSRVGARNRIMPGNSGMSTKPQPVGVKPRTTPPPPRNEKKN
jgi:hypothetical protein